MREVLLVLFWVCMADQAEYVEWDEPAGSLENCNFCVTYGVFIGMVLRMLAKVLPIMAFGVVLAWIIFSVTKHPRPMRMAIILCGFFLAMTLLGVLVCHVGYALSFRIQRHVRLSATEIRCMTLSKPECYLFCNVTRVLIEPTSNGDHRMIVDGVRGELCRLRVPGGIDVDSIARLTPKEKLARG